jgi:selenocysteine lyase/cysteine desulfurase
MSLATLTRQPLPTPAPPAPPRDHLRAVPAPAADPFAPLPRTVSENLGVPTLHRTVVDYANFDHAASTPALESVKAAVDVALDAAQLAPHVPVDIDALGVDFVAFSGHKLYAPFGAGVLAGRADWLNGASPYLRGGGATAKVTPKAVQWSEGAARHEAGSPNVLGAIALAAACATIAGSRAAVEAHEESLATRLRDGLASIPGVRTYSVFGEDHPRVGVAAFTVDGLDSSLVSAALSAEYGIGVRDGKFCAHLLVDALLDDDTAGTAVRASVGLANTVEHVDRLLRAVTTLAAGGPAFDYELTADGWVPTQDPRDLSLPRPW